MSLFSSGKKTVMVPVATLGGVDATPRPFTTSPATHPDRTCLAVPPPAFQVLQISFKLLPEPNTTGQNRSRSQNEIQFQHTRTGQVVDLAGSDREVGINELPRDPRDEYASEIAEMVINKSIFMEARLAKMTEAIRSIEGLNGVGNRIGRVLATDGRTAIVFL